MPKSTAYNVKPVKPTNAAAGWFSQRNKNAAKNSSRKKKSPSKNKSRRRRNNGKH